MSGKILAVLLLAAVVSQGHAVTEIWLNDVTSSHISNPLFPKSIGIGHLFLDTLLSCNIIFPNGMVYEAYPNSNLPDSRITSDQGVSGFTSCSVFFFNLPASFSGTYQLLSHVRHSADNSETLTRQRYHVTFIPSELWPTNAAVKQE